MLFRKAVRQKRIANGAGERNVHRSARMCMSEFGVSEAELARAKAMWMNRYMRPCRHLGEPTNFQVEISPRCQSAPFLTASAETAIKCTVHLL